MSLSLNRTVSSSVEHKDITKLGEILSDSAVKVIKFLESKLQSNGSYGEEAKDLSCYYKSAMAFVNAGKPELARSLLSYIKTSFMTTDGDFLTEPGKKSVKGEYSEFWAYTNGWIVRAANRIDFTEISDVGNRYLAQYCLDDDKGYLTHVPSSESKETDVLTVAHHGVINLELNNLDKAISAGNYLCDAINKQPGIANGFYLRFDRKGEVITDFDKSKLVFYFVNKDEPNQLYFMIGYPCAYLIMLYKKTNDRKYLNAAIEYLEFALKCKGVFESNASHKIAWAASMVYEVTGEIKYLNAIKMIADHFLKQQSESGMWFEEDLNTSYDQSAEIACWFMEIASNLNKMKKKDLLADEKDRKSEKIQSQYSKFVKYGALGTITLFGIGLFVANVFSKKRTSQNVPSQASSPNKLT